jgi:hypothetical protein
MQFAGYRVRRVKRDHQSWVDIEDEERLNRSLEVAFGKVLHRQQSLQVWQAARLALSGLLCAHVV